MHTKQWWLDPFCIITENIAPCWMITALIENKNHVFLACFIIWLLKSSCILLARLWQLLLRVVFFRFWFLLTQRLLLIEVQILMVSINLEWKVFSILAKQLWVIGGMKITVIEWHAVINFLMYLVLVVDIVLILLLFKDLFNFDGN